MSALGYCGINCDECPAYKGTVSSDVALLEKVAGSSWHGASSAPEWVCLGCTPADQSFLAKDCADCRIRDCAIGKGVQNCAACGNYESCRILRDFSKTNHPEVVAKRMDWLHGRFQAPRNERASTTSG